MSHEHSEHCLFHVITKVTGLALKAATVAAAFCAVHELHKIHKGLKK